MLALAELLVLRVLWKFLHIVLAVGHLHEDVIIEQGRDEHACRLDDLHIFKAQLIIAAAGWSLCCGLARGIFAA